MVMESSILKSTKKNLGLAEDYTPFDEDILTHINSAFSNISQIGVISSALSIDDDSSEWSDLNLSEDWLGLLKTYIYLYVRLVFDPPATSFHIQLMEKQRDENYIRLSYLRENALEFEETPSTPSDADPDHANGTQSTPSMVWIMDHNMGYNPAAFRFFNNDEDEMIPESITYVNSNRALAIWPEVLSGTWMAS